MKVQDFMVELEGNPADNVAFDRAIEEAMAEGGLEGLDLFLGEVMESLGDPAVTDTFMKKLDMLFRKERTTEKGRALAWTAGLVAWKLQNDVVRAELYMRAVGDENLPDAATWLEFYRVFYASRGNWLRLEQFMAESGAKAGKSELEIKRYLARTAGEYNNPSKELTYWQDVAKLSESDSEASEHLEKLYVQLQRWPSLAELYRARFNGLPADAVAEKVATLKQMIEIYGDKMHAEPKVLATWQQVLDVDPTSDEAIDSLMTRYEQAGRWPDYAKVLDHKIDQERRLEDRISLMEKKAELLETRFAKPVDALKTWETILELAPGRGDVIEKLKDLYLKRNDFENLIRIRRAEADNLADPAERAAAYAELAVLATDRLRKFPVAVELWELVLGLDDSHADALRNLEMLYERTKELDKLAGTLRRRYELSTSKGDQVQILERLALLYGTKLEDPVGAMDTWRMILDVDPNHDRAKRELRASYLQKHKWDELEWFLRKYGSVDELARTLEGQVNSISASDEKREVLFKLAAIWRDELGQGVRAVKNLETVLGLFPADARAANELIQLYRGLGEWRKLPKVYEIAIAGARDRSERHELRVEAALVQENQLHSPKEAFFLYLAAFQEDMLDEGIQAELEKLAGPSDNWDVYVSVLENAVEVMPDTARRITTWLRIGEIYSENLGDAEAGQAAFNRALDMDTGNRQAIYALEAIYRKLHRDEDLIRILGLRLSLVDDPAERKSVRFEIAEALYERMHKVDEAVATFVAIIADDPFEWRAYAELSDVLLKEKRYSDLRDVLNRHVDALFTTEEINPPVMADLYCRIGLLTAGLDGCGDSAVDSFATALNYDPEHAESIAQLEGMLGVEELRPRLVELLKGPFEATGRHKDLADLIEIELQIKGDSIDTIDLLWKLDALYSNGASDDSKHFRTLSRIMIVTPDVTRAWDGIEAVTRSLDAWRALVDIYTKSLEGIEQADVRVALSLRLARVLWEELASPDEARKVFHGVLELDDSNEAALDALETIYEGQENHPELLKVYKRRFEVSPYAGEKIAYAFKMASELADHLENIEGAIAAVRSVLEIDPDYPAAFKQLDNLYVRAESWYDLADVLQKRIELAEDDRDRTWLRLRMAETLEAKLENVAGAVEVYHVILDGEPTNADALAQLERLFGNEDVKVMVAPILLPAYQANEDNVKLVAVYDVLAEAAADIETRLRHYATISGIYENRLNNLDKAFEYVSKAFRAAPERAALVDEVLRVGSARNAIGEAVMVLAGVVFDIEDEDRRRETHRVIAKVCRDAGVDREMAKKHFRAVLKIDPADLAAIDDLIAMHKEDNEVEPLVGLVMTRADLVTSSDERASLLLWAGDLYADTLGRDEDAINAYNGVLEIEFKNMKAVVALEKLYEKGEKWMELVDVLGRKADYTEDDERIASLKKKGLVQHDRMGNTGDAIETFLQVMALKPGDVDGLRTLDRLYGAAEDWWNLYSTLETLHGLVTGEERLTVHFRMGKLLESEIGDATKAVDIFKDLLDEFPDNTDAVDALENMVRADHATDAAFGILSPVLAARQEWMRLYVVYEVITDREEDVARKVANLLKMGEIAETRMGEPLRGFECYGKAFVTDPLNVEARQHIEALATAHDMWDNVPGLMLEGAKVVEGTAHALELRLHAARILRDSISDLPAAAAAFEKIIEDNENNAEALSALDELYSTLEKWDDLARILRAEYDATQVVDDKVRFILRFASVSEVHLDNSKAALEARQEVLYLVPNQPDAVAGMRATFDSGRHRADILGIIEPIYIETGAFKDLAEVYEAVLTDITDPDDRRGVMTRLAEVWEKNLSSETAAMTWYGRALEIDPGDESLLIQIEILAGSSGNFKLLLDILLAAAKACGDDERKVYLWHKALETARDKLADQAQAEQIGRWILELQENDRVALSALDAMYVDQSRWADLLAILNTEVAAADYDEEKIGFLMRVGALQRDRLDNSDGAVLAFTQVLKADEMHRDALTALSHLHEARGEWEALFNVLARLADGESTGDGRAVIQRRMAVLAEEKLDRADTALQLWDEVSRVETSDVVALRNLERLHAAAGDWTAFVESCDRELPLVSDDMARSGELLRAIAKAAEVELGDAYQAQAAWRRILEMSPREMDALQSLRRLYRESGDSQALWGILEALVNTGMIGGDDLLALQRELAELLTSDLRKLDEAIVWWNRVLELSADDMDALKKLEGLYDETGRFNDCVGVIKRIVSLTGDAQAQAAMLTRAAEIQADQMKDLAAAAETLQSVVGIIGNNMETSEKLQDLYNRLENWDGLRDVLLDRDALLKEVDDKVNNYAECARVCEERQGSQSNAFWVYVKAAIVNPADENISLELWRLAQVLQNWEEYVTALTPVVDQMGEDQRLEHLVRFGEVLHKYTQKTADAIGFYEKVLKNWPENEPALEALTVLYADANDWNKLVAVLEKRVELTADYLQKVEFQSLAAQVLEAKLADPRRAVVAYAKVLDYDDRHVETIDALVRLYGDLKDWEKLVEALGRKADVAPEQEIDVRFRIGQILEGEIRDPRRAIGAYQTILEQSASHTSSIERLQSLYAGLQDWVGLADVFQRLLDMASETPDRILYCYKLAELFETSLDDKRRALEYWLQILDLDPLDHEVFEAAAKIMTDLEDYNELINLYENRLMKVEDREIRITTLQREATLYEQKMEDLNAAISCYQRMLGFQPDYQPAFENLIRLFSSMESWYDVVDTYVRWKDQVDSDERMVDLMMKAVDVVRYKLENPDRAIDMLRGILVVDPVNGSASKCLIEIYTDLLDWEKVAGVYLSMEAAVTNEDEKARLRAAAGDVYLHHLKDRVHAVEHYERALSWNPRMTEVSMALAATYVQAAMWEKAEPLLDILNSDGKVMADAGRAAEIHFNMGLCAEKLFDFEKAFREYGYAIKARPNHFRTSLGIGRYYQRKELWQLAKDHLMKAVSLGKDELTDEEMIDLGFALGEVNLALNDDREAGVWLDKVLSLAPANEKAVDLQIAIAERRQDWPAVIRYKQARVDAHNDPYERFSVLLEVGDIYQEKMGNTHGATAAYREALGIEPGAKVALMRLYNLYLKNGEYLDALSLLKAMADAEDTKEGRARVYVQMAAIYQEKLNDDTAAIQALDDALDADPDRLEAFRAIDEILTQQKDWVSQAMAYTKMIHRLKGRGNSELEYRLQANLGEIYRSRLKDPHAAVEAYQAAAKIKPDEKRTYEILAQLFELKESDEDKAVEAHRQLVALGPISKDAAASYKSMRRLYMKMNQFDKAFVVSSIMRAMEIADEEEAKFYDDNLEPGIPWFTGTIEPARWESHLMAKDEDIVLGRMLQVIYQGVGPYLDLKDLRDLGLRRKPDMDLDQKLVFVNIYKAASKALGPLPHKVYRDDNPTGMKVEYLAPPALIVGSDMMSGHDEYELAFQIGRQLTYLHPMHFLAAVKNLTELKVILAGVFKYCKPEMEFGAGAEVVTELVRTIDRKMNQQQKNQMTKLVDDFLRRHQESLDEVFRNYFRSMEITALRAATLVSCNVPAVMNALRVEQSGFSRMERREKIEEVLRFAISEDHFVLRRALGISIDKDVV